VVRPPPRTKTLTIFYFLFFSLFGHQGGWTISMGHESGLATPRAKILTIFFFFLIIRGGRTTPRTHIHQKSRIHCQRGEIASHPLLCKRNNVYKSITLIFFNNMNCTFPKNLSTFGKMEMVPKSTWSHICLTWKSKVNACQGLDA